MAESQTISGREGSPDLDRPRSSTSAFVLLRKREVISSQEYIRCTEPISPSPRPSFEGNQKSKDEVLSPQRDSHIDTVKQHGSHDLSMGNFRSVSSPDTLKTDKFFEGGRSTNSLRQRPGYVLQSASDSQVGTIWQPPLQAQSYNTHKPCEKIMRHQSESSAIVSSAPVPGISLQDLSPGGSNDNSQHNGPKSQPSSRAQTSSTRTPMTPKYRRRKDAGPKCDYFGNILSARDEDRPEDSPDQHLALVRSIASTKDGSDDEDDEEGEVQVVCDRDTFAGMLENPPTPRSRSSTSRELIRSPTLGTPAVIWNWIPNQRRSDKLQPFFCIAEALGKDLIITHQKTGYIYALSAQNSQGLNHIKVGWTTDPKKRFKEHTACYGTCNLIYPVPGVHFLPLKHAARVEALVHAELVASSLTLECCPRIHRHGAHKEWFDVDVDHVITVIERWVAWANGSPFEVIKKGTCGAKEERRESRMASPKPSPDTVWRLKTQDQSIMGLCWPLVMAAG